MGEAVGGVPAVGRWGRWGFCPSKSLCDSRAERRGKARRDFARLQKMLTRQESTTPSVLKTGMLLKEGTSPPWNWHSRHFILEDSCLKCAAGPLHD